MLFRLLAASDTSFIDSDAAKLMFGAAVLGGIIYGINLLRDLRKNITSEVRMQMQADDEETEARKIPQPLTIKAHVDFTPYNEHKELKNEFERLREQRRADVHGLHLKIEQGLKETRIDIGQAVKELGELQITTENQNDQLVAIRVEQNSVGMRIDAMPQRIINILKETKDLL